MVPCYINREDNTFQPICNPLERETLKIDIKLPWSPEEDEALESLIKIQRTKNWALVAKEMNKIFHSQNQ